MSFSRILQVTGLAMLVVGVVGFLAFLHAFYGGGNPIAAMGEPLGLNPMRGYQRSLWLVLAGCVVSFLVAPLWQRCAAPVWSRVTGFRRPQIVGPLRRSAERGRQFVRRFWHAARRNLAPLGRFVPLGIAVAACCWLYSGFLFHTYAGADFPPAVSYAVNFQIAFDHGQWLPRLVEFAREFQFGMGTVDGTPPTPDAPVFQYYGFFASALAYPFLSMGVPGPEAVGCAVLVSFLIGTVALYVTGIVLGAAPGLALLGTVSYLFSPWLISNVYARGGIAEAVSQGLLPLLPLGIAAAWREHYRASIIIVALAIAMLALSHNVFLLYGICFCGIFCVFNYLAQLLETRVRSVPSALAASAASMSVGIGVLLGLALTVWQWAPAFMTIAQTIWINQISESLAPMKNADLSGAYWLPKRYSYGTAETPFFFTIGWWTIPSVVGVALIAARSRFRQVVVIVALFLSFFLLCYVPDLIFPHLPGFFTATQFTFRLLAFLSLIGALALCLYPRPVGRVIVGATIALIALSQLGVIFYPMPYFRYTDDQYAKGWEVNAFHPASTLASGEFRVDQQGWLFRRHTFDVSKLREKTGAWDSPILLRVIGQPAPGMGDFTISVGELPVNQDTQLPISGTFYETRPASQSPIDMTFTLPKTSQQVRLFSSRYELYAAFIEMFMKPSRVYLIEAPATSYVYADALDRTYHHGLRRVFAVKPDRTADFHPTAKGRYTFEIPMVYSRFLVARQHGGLIPTWSDLNYRLNVQVDDLNAPVEVVYQLPWWTWTLAGSALAILVALACLTQSMKQRLRHGLGRLAAIRSVAAPAGGVIKS